MAIRKLTVDIPEELYTKFFTTVTEKGGRWRGKKREDTALKAFRSAVEVALIKFLESLEA